MRLATRISTNHFVVLDNSFSEGLINVPTDLAFVELCETVWEMLMRDIRMWSVRKSSHGSQGDHGFDTKPFKVISKYPAVYTTVHVLVICILR